jgi:hypothetical protein
MPLNLSLLSLLLMTRYAVGRRPHLRQSSCKLEELAKWRLNYFKNANNPIPVDFVITMIKLNAPTSEMRPDGCVSLPLTRYF